MLKLCAYRNLKCPELAVDYGLWEVLATKTAPKPGSSP
jgi:hypothetical protein